MTPLEAVEEQYKGFFRCQCPEPDRPGWVHLVPLDCEPLRDGETIEEWRTRRHEWWEGRL